MKKIFFLALLLMPILTTNGQQQLSYSYDIAGNRISRTIIVGAYNSTAGSVHQDTTRIYLDSIEGRQLAINAYSTQPRLTIAVEEYDSSLKGEYSLFDKKGLLLAKEKICGFFTR